MINGTNAAAAIADYACLWCKIHKDNRWDMGKPISYYNEEPMSCTLQEIQNLYPSKDNFGCTHEPLLNIPLTHVIPDELHLLLRITDKLLKNVIEKVQERDALEDFNKPRGQPKERHLSRLVKEIQMNWDNHFLYGTKRMQMALKVKLRSFQPFGVPEKKAF